MSADNEKYESGEIIVLTDEEGNDVELENLDRISYKGKEYAVMMPIEENESDEAADVVIFRIEPNDGEGEGYSVIEDEKTLVEVFELFKERSKDQFEFE